MSNAGRIAGISDISQGIGLDLKPYLLGAAGNAPGRGAPGTDGDFEIGLDAFYNVTPALKANFTVNTDFAETEVDERRTNLTRFPLFFPEKREFFLDGSNFFEFPGGDESPFFSRRIGLNAGEPQPIIYGAKLIGQAGRQDVGFLQVSTSEEEFDRGGALVRLKGEDFTVARVKRRFGSQSSAGMIYTRRAPRDSLVDARHSGGRGLSPSPRRISSAGRPSTPAHGTFTPPSRSSSTRIASRRPKASGFSYGWQASVSKDPYRAEVSFKEVQAAPTMPAIGFTPRQNFRNWNPELNWSPRFSGHRWFRGVQISGEGDINLNLDNHVVDRNLQLTPMELEFHSGDSVEFQMFKQTENLDEDFEIADGVILPIGTSYDWLRYQVVYDGAEHRALSGRVEYSFGDFWNGSRRELNLDLTLRPRPGLSVQLSSEFNDVDAAARVVHDEALSPRRAHAVQSVDLAEQQHSVRFGER